MDVISEHGPQTPGATDTAGKWTTGQVLSVRYWTPTLLSFRTTRDRGFRFKPGHYARLGLQGKDGEIVWRPYSLVSAPARRSRRAGRWR